MMRTATIERKTKETEIKAELNLDGAGNASIDTGVGFFDHMLHSFTVHSGFDLTLRCKGDLEVDGHHTVEDVGIVLGKAIGQALGDKAGIARFGSAFIPMDEALGFAAVDTSSRPFLVFRCAFSSERTGGFENALAEEFFRALAYHAGLTLHLELKYGSNSHHELESIFKSFAYALKAAVTPTGREGVLSSKGVL